MNFDIETQTLPSAVELVYLFKQTTWASKREERDVALLLDGISVFVVIREGSKLIGFGRAITDGFYRALLDDIIVDSKYQRKGLGLIIVGNLLGQLKGTEEIFLNTKPQLECHYQKFGFQKIKGITMKL